MHPDAFVDDCTVLFFFFTQKLVKVGIQLRTLIGDEFHWDAQAVPSSVVPSIVCFKFSRCG